MGHFLLQGPFPSPPPLVFLFYPLKKNRRMARKVPFPLIGPRYYGLVTILPSNSGDKLGLLNLRSSGSWFGVGLVIDCYSRSRLTERLGVKGRDILVGTECPDNYINCFYYTHLPNRVTDLTVFVSHSPLCLSSRNIIQF